MGEEAEECARERTVWASVRVAHGRRWLGRRGRAKERRVGHSGGKGVLWRIVPGEFREGVHEHW